MSPQRLSDRYEVESLRLHPEKVVRHRALIAAVKRILPEGSVYHVLAHTPDQAEDLHVILVDDQSVIRFWLARGEQDAQPFDVEISSFRDYRNAIGQGRHRIRLDRAAEAARKLIVAPPS